MKQEMWWMQSFMKVLVDIFYRAQEGHACAYSIPEATYIDYLALNYKN